MKANELVRSKEKVQNEEEQRTTTKKRKHELTQEQLDEVYEIMIPRFVKGKKDGTYANLDVFLNSHDSDPLTPSQRPSFGRKKRFWLTEGSIPPRQENKDRYTKHRKNKDLLAPDLMKWCLQQKADNGKMKTVIYSFNNMIVF